MQKETRLGLHATHCMETRNRPADQAKGD